MEHTIEDVDIFNLLDHVYENKDEIRETEAKCSHCGSENTENNSGLIICKDCTKLVGKDTRGKAKTELFCKECNSDNFLIFDTNYGFIICENCDNLVSTYFDSSSELRQFMGDDRDEGAARYIGQSNYLLPQTSLSTPCNNIANPKIRMVSNWSKMPYKERSLNNSFKIIKEKCEQANMKKKEEDDAKIMFKHAIDQKIIRGKKRQGMLIACIHYASMKNNNSKRPQELASQFNIKTKVITKGLHTYYNLKKNQEKNPEDTHKEFYDFNETNSPISYINNICKRLEMSQYHRDETLRVADNIHKLGLSTDHVPISIATGSILLISQVYGLGIGKRTLSSVAEVSEPTLNKVYRELNQYRKVLFAKEKVIDLILKKMEEDVYADGDIIHNPEEILDIKQDQKLLKDLLEDLINIL